MISEGAGLETRVRIGSIMAMLIIAKLEVEQEVMDSRGRPIGYVFVVIED